MASQDSLPPAPIQGSRQWRLDYESALQETDHKILFKRVEIAEAAILNCQEAMEPNLDARELTEMEIALAKLRHMKKEILNF